MLRVIDRDEEGFEILMRRHEDSVFRLAVRILEGNTDEARDVAQEVFIRLWENPHAWKPTALFTTWLYRVTMNRALNRRRMLKLKSIFSLSDVKSLGFAQSDNNAPDRQLLQDEAQVRFEYEFNRLPPRQRAALHLRYRENLPVAEVAAAMSVSLKSVESLLSRAKETLRARLRNSPHYDNE